MKAMLKKSILFALVLMVFVSCSKDNDELLPADPAAVTGTWKNITMTTYITAKSTDGTTVNILDDGKYAEFKPTGTVHYFYQNGTEFKTKAYQLINANTLLLDGTSYRVQENLTGTVNKMTLVSTSNDKRVVYVFER